MVCNRELPLESTHESLLNLFEFVNTICNECNTPEKMMPIRDIIVIASGIIVLISLAEKKKKKNKIDDSLF